MPLLEAQGLNVVYEPSRGARVWSVRDVDLTLEQGEFVGLVGESGCGKSTLGYAITRMLRPPAKLSGGRILFDGQDVTEIRGEALRRYRHRGFSLVLQSGMNALNPVRSVEDHFGDVLRAHRRISGTEIRRRAAELLDKVHLPAAHPVPLPARTVGRHAAAHLHRGGAGPRPASGGLRRAHHRAGRHRAGRGDADHQGTPARGRVHRAAHQPRPRHRRRLHRPADGDVRGTHRRGPAVRHRAAAGHPPVHAGPAALLRRSARGRRAAGGHPGQPAGPVAGADRVPVRPAVHAAGGRLPHGVPPLTEVGGGLAACAVAARSAEEAGHVR